jgi:hypothetical protein
MMQRVARITIPGYWHHLTRHRNRSQTVFYDDLERKTYLELLGRYLSPFKVQMIGCSLMTNDAHNVSIPSMKMSLLKGFGRVQNDFPAGRIFEGIGLAISGEIAFSPVHWMKITSGRLCAILN